MKRDYCAKCGRFGGGWTNAKAEKRLIAAARKWRRAWSSGFGNSWDDDAELIRSVDAYERTRASQKGKRK